MLKRKEDDTIYLCVCIHPVFTLTLLCEEPWERYKDGSGRGILGQSRDLENHVNTWDYSWDFFHYQ